LAKARYERDFFSIKNEKPIGASSVAAEMGY